ncbi:MAG: alanine/glycine:cation symporter family protein [Acutalibacteraceae bacterium]
MFDSISAVTEKINEIIWGFPTIVLLLACGIFFSVLLKFFQFTKIRLWLSNTLFSLFKKDVRKTGDSKGISQFQAVSTALAATIGTGNIAGVATAISAGGPGAVFWMWFSACFSMMTSYSENVLGIFYRKKNESGEWCGGPMFYMKEGLSQNSKTKKFAKPLAVLYAFLLMIAALGIGNMTQANSISESVGSVFGFSVYAVAAVLTLIALAVIAGGVKRIAGVTEKLVPFMALFYFLTTLYIFVLNYKTIPYVFSSIFKNAFSFRAVFGAAGGLAIKKCVSMGFRRGIFSNEAGLGASVTVNACSDVKEPAKQGMWGIFQVFTDTLVICTMTAFALLSTTVHAVPLSQALENLSSQTQYVYIGEEKDFSGGKLMLADMNANRIIKKDDSGKAYTAKSGNGSFTVKLAYSDEYTYSNVMALRPVTDKDGNITDITLSSVDGVSLVLLAFSERFGSVASVLLCISIVLFAFSSIVGWSFYGAKATEYIYGKKGAKIYKGIYILFVFIGAVSKLDLVWRVSDIFNGLMAIVNVLCLFALSGTVVKITQNYLDRKNGKPVSPLISNYDHNES